MNETLTICIYTMSVILVQYGLRGWELACSLGGRLYSVPASKNTLMEAVFIRQPPPSIRD